MPLGGGIPKELLDLQRKLSIVGTILIVILSVIMLAVLASLAGALNEWASRTEKYWSFISTVSTLIGGTIGIWFIWLRFFKTREFAMKLEVTPVAGRIPLPKRNSNLHWLNVKLENKGTISIEDYRIIVSPLLHKGDACISRENLQACGLDELTAQVIDVGALSYEHFIVVLSESEAEAVTFQVQVIVGSYMWQNYITTSNIPDTTNQNKHEGM